MSAPLKSDSKLFFIGIVIFLPLTTFAQSPFRNFANLFTIPKSYVVTYTKTPPVIDGDINDPVWQQAKWSNDFRDIEGDLKPNPPLQTNVKMLWDDSCLYIAAQVRDPHVWAYIKNHDEIVFRDNDFEVFINPNNTTHQYFELEYNARNTVFDLFLNKPYRNGGTPMFSWDAEGMRSAVKVKGTVNDPTDTDKGWTIEIAIPFKAISLANNVQVPSEGSLWRINFSRVEWDTRPENGKYVKLKDNAGHNLPEHNWVWSPQGVVDMHCPERWGYLSFTKSNINNTGFSLPYFELQKRYLWLVYYQEGLWHHKHNVYTASLKAFGLGKQVAINKNINALRIEATPHQFMAFITDKKDNITWAINQDGLVRRYNLTSDE
ncbi:carbohydrate-binding family 9-like protein [Mucilaginibacter sp.]|uniref:carbohydrate-binding family 9-like protein n=1 Tax=Mucilaginibacter sp. TaxID=1882438 RepID=UPI00284B5071|nr:carbohydrate-binding family 9-like protein [Mucilaginibacter sp.]MDR3697964.1 carbohydrate-binding family 9-like protein [Mucilaginibacter sp.]